LKARLLKEDIEILLIKEKDDLLCSKMAYGEVEPENEYWKNQGITTDDPDGWRIVLMNRSYE